MSRRLVPFALALALSACGPATPVGPVTETGALELGDLTLTSGEYHDIYDVSMRADQWLSVSVETADFDPYLIITLPNGTQSELDDSEADNTTSVSTVLRAQEGGTYGINVTSFEPGETGSYQITYEVTDASPAGSAEPVTAEGDAAVVDEVAAE